MAVRAQSVYEAVETLANRFPELSDALDGVLDVLRRQPKNVAEKRDIDKRLVDIAAALIGVREAVVALRDLAVKADAERQGTLQLNISLMKRIQELEADIKEWQREYEPDSDPERPGMFSNIRQALHAFSHRGSTR